MVHPGKPSTGCAMCKARKVKCDEEKPACLQCRRTSRTCPGYVDVIFRDQTDSVTRKQQGRKPPTTQKVSKNPRLAPRKSPDTSSRHLIVHGRSPTHSEHMSQRLLSKLNQLRAHSLSSSVRPPQWLSIQEQAVHICFKNFDVLYGSYDAHNLLLALAPLYQASPEGSPLRVATHAAALSAVAQLPSKRNLQHEAAVAYGKAIKTMTEAIADPEQARSNETLLSTLLLSWYETISASDGSMLAWSNHIEGATQIVRLRGSTQFHDPLGLSLFRAIRTEMFINCLRQGIAPMEFPEIGGWLSDTYVGTYDFRDPVAYLMQYTVKLPGLREEQQKIMEQGRDPSTIDKMASLIGVAHQLETKMSEFDLPENWRPRTTGYVSQFPRDIESAQAWVGPIHTYADIYTASALNKLRSCRMLTAKLIIMGLMWAYPDDYLFREEYRHAAYIEQQAIDDICSSVPSHFVWGRQVTPSDHDNEEIRHTADLIAGYLLHWPLRVARNSPRISEQQRAWIDRQLGHVAERCGVHQASIQPPTTGRIVRIRDEHSPTDES